jgi:hypothetical protein
MSWACVSPLRILNSFNERLYWGLYKNMNGELSLDPYPSSKISNLYKTEIQLRCFKKFLKVPKRNEA